MKSSIILIIGLVLMGCAAAPYNPPQSGPVTTIEFMSKSPHPVYARFYENSKNCTKTHRPTFKNNYTATPIVVSADKEFSFYMGHIYLSYPMVRSCEHTITFTPKEGEYRITSETNSDNTQCYVYVEKRINHTNNYTLEKNIISRSPRQPFLESGEWCAPLP